MSEDILRDGKKFYESGMPVDGSNSFTYTQWGKIPTQSTVTYAFATTSGSRALQDVGFNGLTDAEEQEFYKSAYLDQIQGKVNQAVFDSIFADLPGITITISEDLTGMRCVRPSFNDISTSTTLKQFA